MAGIKLPIEVGQKFLSGGVEVEIVCVTGKKSRYPIIDNYGDCYTLKGNCYEDCEDDLDLQPIPVTITEGVEFSGEAYREEFERLVKDGRELDRLGDNSWDHAGSADFSSDHRYRLRPQHRDAAGNPLKVGDRVEYVGRSDVITELTGSMVRLSEMGTTRPGACRKLTTRTRPLCKQDLIAAPAPAFLSAIGSILWPSFADEECVVVAGEEITYASLVEKAWKWRPSAAQHWQPCEVTEEVLA